MNKAFVDLYFAQGDPFWRSPDIYVDWPVDNPSRDPRNFRQYPVGQPLDQGEAVHVPRRQSDHELHWLVARIRNKGGVKAEQVVLDFQICDPEGAGDSGNFRSIGSTTIGEVPGGDLPTYGVFGWQVPAQHGSHIRVYVQIKISGSRSTPGVLRSRWTTLGSPSGSICIQGYLGLTGTH